MTTIPRRAPPGLGYEPIDRSMNERLAHENEQLAAVYRVIAADRSLHKLYHEVRLLSFLYNRRRYANDPNVTTQQLYALLASERARCYFAASNADQYLATYRVHA